MQRLYSLVERLVAGDDILVHEAPRERTAPGLPLIAGPQIEVIEGTAREDLARRCSDLARRSAVALSSLHRDGLDGIAVGTADRTMFVDLRRNDGVPPALRDLLAGSTRKIVHGLAHDARRLLSAGVTVTNVVDLYAAAVLSDGYARERSAQEYGLDALVARHLQGNLVAGRRIAARCGSEVRALVLLEPRLKAAVERAGVGQVWQLENDAVVPIAAVELAGFTIDVPQVQRRLDDCEHQRSEARGQLSAILGEFDIDNADDLRAVLGHACGFAFAFTTGPHLRALAQRFPFLSEVVRYREASVHKHHLECWLKSADTNDRVHPTFDSMGAATGRMTCFAPPLHSTPRVLRSCFVASPGARLIIADYHAIELAIIANFTRDPELMNCFRRGIDPHRRTASHLAGVQMARVPDSLRGRAKPINYGFAFGMGVHTFREYAAEMYGHVFDEPTATRVRRRFFELYRRVAAWHEHVRTQGSKSLAVRSPCGRLRRFEKFELPAYLSTPIQSLAASGFKRALVLMNDRLQPTEAKIIHLQHDEFVVEAPEKCVLQVARIVEEVMTEAMHQFVQAVPIKVKVTIAKSWDGTE